MMRRATDADLSTIEAWMRAEFEEHGQPFRSIWHNWKMIPDMHAEGTLYVCDSPRKKAIGFVGLASDATTPELMAVKPSFRGRGYGKRIAKWIIHRCIRAGRSDITVYVVDEAIGFWRRMGFAGEESATGGCVFMRHPLDPLA